MSGPVFVGIDLGTSAMKGIAVAGDGTVVARTRSPYVTHRAGEGVAEQNPADWLDALSFVVSGLLAESEPAGWQAVGLSGMLPTLVLLDSAGHPIGPAITWEDARAEHAGTLLEGAIGGDRLYELTGQRVDGRYLLPMHARAAQDDPDGAGRARHVVGGKDYLHAVLTGSLATDPSTAAGFGCYGLEAHAWIGEVVEAATSAVPVQPALPDIEPSTSSRPLTEDVARALGLPSGLPIVLGGADSVLGAFGLGARAPGDVAYLSGTSSVVLGISRDAQRDPRRRYLVTPLAGVDGFGLEMDLLATGSALAWLAALLAVEGAPGVLALAADRAPDGAPEFLPYLAPGEQGALWDPGLTGSILGLTLSVTRADLARGLLNGIILESRRCLGTLEEALGVGPVLYSGPGDGGLFIADLADASGRTVRSSGLDAGDHSAFGAAVLAAKALGGEVVVSTEGSPRKREPDPERAALWRLLADRHDRALGAQQESLASRRNHLL